MIWEFSTSLKSSLLIVAFPWSEVVQLKLRSQMASQSSSQLSRFCVNQLEAYISYVSLCLSALFFKVQITGWSSPSFWWCHPFLLPPPLCQSHSFSSLWLKKKRAIAWLFLKLLQSIKGTLQIFYLVLFSFILSFSFSGTEMQPVK